MTNNKGKTAKYYSRLSARDLAVTVILKVLYQGAYANLALDKALDASRLTGSDRGLATELINGTIRMQKHLDWVLKLFLKRGEQKISGRLYVILLCALYQLLFLDKVPPYAAINEAVEQARKVDPGKTGLVNGILRNVERNRANLEFPDPEKEPVAHLATYYSHPEWMVRRWLGRYGWEDTRNLLEFNNQAPNMTVRVNTLKTDRDTLQQILADEGVKSETGEIWEDCLVLQELPLPLYRLKSYRDGLFYIQGQSSMLMAPALGPQPGEVVYDLCSGVGGKSTHLGQLMRNRGKIVAWDLHRHKLDLLQMNCERLGISIVETRAGDILASLGEAHYGDRVLLDAPCSGTGVLRSRADMRWQRKETDLEHLTRLQSSLLDRAADMLEPGGRMLYCTCSLEPEENEDIITAFIKRRPDYELVDITESLAGYPYNETERMQARAGYFTVFPPAKSSEGMFLGLMRRK